MNSFTKNNIKRGWILYIMLVFPVVWYVVFCYVPMGGIIVAFKDYNVYRGIIESPWSSEDIFKHFKAFLGDRYFWEVLLNTFIIGTVNTAINFPAPILLALMFNELKDGPFKRISQTVSYLPYFISTVAIVSIVIAMLSPSTGIVNNIIKRFGAEPINFIMEPKYFIPIYVLTNMWKNIGWGTIIYIASMSNVNPELYEAAGIEGAGRLRKMWHITLPAIKPTIVILLILSMPGILAVDFETILLLQRPQTYSVSDVIPTYVYRKGLLDSRFDYGTALGLFFSIVNMGIIYSSNKFSKKAADISIW